jgi:hypothetical protein
LTVLVVHLLSKKLKDLILAVKREQQATEAVLSTSTDSVWECSIRLSKE